MAIATLSSKFQIAVPKAVREAMALEAGQQFEMIPMGNILQLVPRKSIRELRGLAQGANPENYRDRQDRG